MAQDAWPKSDNEVLFASEINDLRLKSINVNHVGSITGSVTYTNIGSDVIAGASGGTIIGMNSLLISNNDAGQSRIRYNFSGVNTGDWFYVRRQLRDDGANDNLSSCFQSGVAAVDVNLFLMDGLQTMGTCGMAGIPIADDTFVVSTQLANRSGLAVSEITAQNSMLMFTMTGSHA